MAVDGGLDLTPPRTATGLSTLSGDAIDWIALPSESHHRALSLP